MKTPRLATTAAGVFVEFHDAQGHTVGQAVFADWNGRPVPAVGDVLRCAAHNPLTGSCEEIAGQVTRRHFELQHADGEPCVWVRLELTVAGPSKRGPPPPFSMN